MDWGAIFQTILPYAILIITLYFLCKILAIPFPILIKSIPDEFKKSYGFLCFCGFILLAFLVGALASNTIITDELFSVVFSKAISAGNIIPFNPNSALWAIVVCFLGNFGILAYFKKK